MGRLQARNEADKLFWRIPHGNSLEACAQHLSQPQLSLLDPDSQPKEGKVMGMFDKDKVFAPDGKLDDFAEQGQEFILWDCLIQTEEFTYDEKEKPIPMAHLVVSHTNSPEDKKTVSSLSGPICNKVREKDDDDLPAIVRLEVVPASKDSWNDATVIKFIEAYAESKSKAATA